jgi:hypothetical protein
MEHVRRQHLVSFID